MRAYNEKAIVCGIDFEWNMKKSDGDIGFIVPFLQYNWEKLGVGYRVWWYYKTSIGNGTGMRIVVKGVDK